MEAQVLQELDSSSSIVWFFWHSNDQSATRSMNEWENYLRSIGVPCVTMVANSTSRLQIGVSPTDRDFQLLPYEEVNHKKWRPVQVTLAWGVCVVVCTETRTPGCADHINNQTFIEVSTGRNDRIVTWVDEPDFEYFCNALQWYMDYTSL